MALKTDFIASFFFFFNKILLVKAGRKMLN